jgi:hypothetical protein
VVVWAWVDWGLGGLSTDHEMVFGTVGVFFSGWDIGEGSLYA